MSERVLADVTGLLRERGVGITFMDIGSRNGIRELPELAGVVDAYGFEPNPEEYRKVVTGDTDVVRMGGTPSPPYRHVEVAPCAVGERDGVSDFYVTPGPGACGMREPDVDRLREIVWKGRGYAKNFGDDIFAGYRKIRVKVRTLDGVVRERGMAHIDYLKIDVEGSEYEVLTGAMAILPHTGVIKVETCFIPFRKDQKLFSHVDLLLRGLGFDLLGYEIDRAQVGYKQRTTPVEYLPGVVADRYGQPLSADAIYVNRGVRDADRALAQAAVLIEKKYWDEGLHILKTRTDVRLARLLDHLKSAECYDAPGYWLKAWGYQVVDTVIDRAAALRRWLWA